MMRLSTDIYIEKRHFRNLGKDHLVLVVEVRDIAHVHLQLMEWARQMEEMMRKLNIERLG